MHFSTLTLALVASLALAGCSREAAPDPVGQDLALRQATEHNLGVVVDIARELRDQRGAVQPLPQEEVFAAVRQRHPASDPKSDVLNDGWGRPLRYEIIHETQESTLRNGFRVVSSGANGEFENGGGDDLQRETVITETLSGG